MDTERGLGQTRPNTFGCDTNAAVGPQWRNTGLCESSSVLIRKQTPLVASLSKTLPVWSQETTASHSSQSPDTELSALLLSLLILKRKGFQRAKEMLAPPTIYLSTRQIWPNPNHRTQSPRPVQQGRHRAESYLRASAGDPGIALGAASIVQKVLPVIAAETRVEVSHTYQGSFHRKSQAPGWQGIRMKLQKDGQFRKDQKTVQWDKRKKQKERNTGEIKMHL